MFRRIFILFFFFVGIYCADVYAVSWDQYNECVSKNPTAEQSVLCTKEFYSKHGVSVESLCKSHDA